MKIKKPNFLIIGAAKCGTTTLASILDQHRDVCMGRPKEVCFFQDTMDFKPNLNYAKGWEWYKKAFAHYNGEKLVGEATPSYSDRSRSPNTARRVYEFNPEMKIIYMVRNPLERQISAFKMQWFEYKNNLWPDRLETQLAGNGFDYWMQKQKEIKQWDECKYNYQLEVYRAYFPSNQIYVTFLEDWIKNQSKEVCKVLHFLDIENNMTTTQLNKKENTAGDRSVEVKFLKNLRSTRFLKPLKKILPKNVKENINKKLISKKLEYPDITKNSCKDFIDYVKDDANILLKKQNKEQSFWDLG